MRRSLLVLFAVVVAALTFSAAAVAAPHAGRHRAGPAASDPEFSPLEPLAGKIMDLGQARYPLVFAGDRLAAGRLDVYVTSGSDDKAFLNGIARLDRQHLPYTVSYVSRSYAVQAATSKWIRARIKTLAGEGMAIDSWGPHPSDDAVLVALQRPSHAQLTALGKAAAALRHGSGLARRPANWPAGRVTPGSYASVAGAVLNAEAPSAGDIVVAPGLSKGPVRVADQYNDNSPFFGADQIRTPLEEGGYNLCTSDFSFTGAVNPANSWIVTAAHCSQWGKGVPFYTCYTKDSNGNCNYTMGTVSKAYDNFSGTDDDFETIGATGLPAIWDDSGTGDYWNVVGQIDPVQGDLVSTEGYTNGATFRLAVTSAGPGTCFVDVGDGANNTVCNGIEIDAGGVDACQGGDSGGPIFQRESAAGIVNAVGIIQASAINGPAWYCYGELISHIESEANLVLETSGG